MAFKNKFIYLKPFHTMRWTEFGEKKLYFFGRYVKNQTLINIVNFGILPVLKWKIKYLIRQFEVFFIYRVHPFRITYILNKDGLSCSEKDRKILKAYSDKNNLGWHWC